METLGGPLFTVAGAGESHGPGVTTIVMGTPPGFEIRRAEIQKHLDRRRPGGNKHGTPRNEKDQVILTSGIYQPDGPTLLGGGRIRFSIGDAEFETDAYDVGRSTGEPIAALVLSTRKKSQDYSQLSGGDAPVRPGHTDLVKHHQSRGYVDIRGGGRSSYRSTISDVVGGSVAREVLRQRFGTRIFSSITSVGSLESSTRLVDAIDDTLDPAAADALETRLADAAIASVDAEFADRAADLIRETRKSGDSLGASVEVVAFNPPPLVGSPLYDSLKLRLMGSLGGLNAVQSCEVGDGWAVTQRRGSQNNDAIRGEGYVGNTHGGMIGGITTGKPIVARVGFKPTSTIHQTQQSVTKSFNEIDFALASGRHDPCVGVRAGVTLESRLAIELLNATLQTAATRIDQPWFDWFGESS